METCEWILEEGCWDDDIWNTECGNMFHFIDGDPKENKFKFCPYFCKAILEIEESADQENQED